MDTDTQSDETTFKYLGINNKKEYEQEVADRKRRNRLEKKYRKYPE